MLTHATTHSRDVRHNNKKMKITLIILLAVLAYNVCAQNQAPIIDMHVHSYAFDQATVEELKFNGNKDFYGNQGSLSKEEHFRDTYERFRKFNIVKAVVSGSLESVKYWKVNDTDNRIIRGILIFSAKDDGMNPKRFESLVKDGTIQVFGEIGAYYSGSTLSDPEWEPYLKICEQYDIPVAIHTGGGEPGGTYTWSPKARLRLGDPYLIEDALVKFPKLRVNMMHAGGEDWPEHAIRLLDYYPHLYTDLGVMLWVNPNTKRYIKEFLRNVKEAGYLDRVMFGSDQMFWPDAIDRSIEYLNSLDFLTNEDKRDILYNNAARFLKLNNDNTVPNKK